MAANQLAVVTGASTGIGLELARCCAQGGFNLVIAADEPEIERVAVDLRRLGTSVEAVEADLATTEGVDKHLVDTNITGTLYLIHRAGNEMLRRNSGRILITGSIAGFTPGSFQAVYNASKAFLDSFSFALREELRDSGVTVTCLMPGATETEFFRRADMMDTKVGTEPKDSAYDVAKAGFDAMLRGESDIVTGMKNKIQTTVANVTPNEMLAKQHRKMAEPGTAKS